MCVIFEDVECFWKKTDWKDLLSLNSVGSWFLPLKDTIERAVLTTVVFSAIICTTEANTGGNDS